MALICKEDRQPNKNAQILMRKSDGMTSTVIFSLTKMFVFKSAVKEVHIA